MEVAVMHGVGRVMVDGHAEKRNRELRRQFPTPGARENDGSGLRALAHEMRKLGMTVHVNGGPSTDGPLSQGTLEN